MTVSVRRQFTIGMTWILMLAGVTILLLRMRGEIDQIHAVLLYLLIVLGGSASSGRVLGLTLACVSFVLIDYLFQRPYGLLSVSGPGDGLVLAAFLCTAGVTTHLLAKATAAANVARERADEIAFLARLGSEALSTGSAEDAQQAVTRLIQDELRVAECTIEMPDHVEGESADIEIGGGLHHLRLPLVVHGRAVGTLHIRHDASLTLDPAQRRFLDALVYYAALAVERVRLVAAAEHAEALREADRLKDIVLASVSHDLRTPLTTIKALAQSSVRQGDTQASIIVEQADRLARLVNDLLDLSRLRSGTFPLEPEINSAEDLVGTVLRQITGLPHQPVLRVIIDRERPALYGRFDFVQTLRILTNLIENAIRFSPPGAPIEIQVQRAGTRLEFVVRDRGPGVPADEHERIFEPFYRGRQYSTDRRGSGLGLSIARHLAGLQEGTITFAPRPGGGSAFTLVLPAVDPPSAAPSLADIPA